jgi:hypothetical protein
MKNKNWNERWALRSTFSATTLRNRTWFTMLRQKTGAPLAARPSHQRFPIHNGLSLTRTDYLRPCGRR